MFSIAAREARGADGGGPGYIGCGFGSSSSLQTDSSACSENFWDANEIVGGCGEDEEPFDQVPSAVSGLAQAPDSLDPAERLFDPLSLGHADGIAGMTGGAPIDCGAAAAVVLRHMRGAAALATAGDEVGGVVELVGTHRTARLGIVLDHIESRRALGGAGGLGQPGIDDEVVPVLHHHMAHVAELGLLAGALAKQPCVGVRRRGMRLIGALLATEVALGVTPPARARRRRLSALLWDKSLHSCPGPHQRALA